MSEYDTAYTTGRGLEIGAQDRIARDNISLAADLAAKKTAAILHEKYGDIIQKQKEEIDRLYNSAIAWRETTRHYADLAGATKEEVLAIRAAKLADQERIDEDQSHSMSM